MTIKEHENSILTKESSDPVERYLKNIIQRYFQIENNITQETKESIIIQAYTRLKEIFNAYSSKYIMCLNEKSGAIDLSISGLGGQEKFEKNTAYNKDFCGIQNETKTLYDGTEVTYNNYGIEQEDHIVSGDDDRLSDARIPIAHVHEIEDINGLKEILEQYNLINGGFHIHNNLRILNLLVYIGSRTSIDLILLEDLKNKVDKAFDRFTETDEYFINTAKQFLNQFHDIFEPINKKIQYVEANIDSWIKGFVAEANIYSDTKIVQVRNEVYHFLQNFLSIDEYNLINEILERSIHLVHSGEEDVSGILLRNPIKDSVCTYTWTGLYMGFEFVIKSGYTKLFLSGEHSIHIERNYYNSLNECMCKVYFKYTNDGITYRDQLPHVYQINGSNHDFILVNYNTDQYNNINVSFQRMSYLPTCLDKYFTFNAYIEDYSGKASDTSFCVVREENDINNPAVSGVDNLVIPVKSTYDSYLGTTENHESLAFEASSKKKEPSDTYNTQVDLKWFIDSVASYNYKIFRRINGGEWEDLMYSEAFSSANTGVLKDIYDSGSIYTITPAPDFSIVERIDPVQREKVWALDETTGILKSSVNNAQFDVLLTGSSYDTYRHRATLTISNPNGEDNDAIIIVISAVGSGNNLHTLSLICDRGGDEHMPTHERNCLLVCDYSTPYQVVLNKRIEHGVTDYSSWSSSQKISFDIRKDQENIVIYTSGFYTLAGVNNYDETRIDYNTRLTASFSEIQTATGIDFRNGMVGYGNYSQKNATIVGINFETYSTYIDTEYTDYIKDTRTPYAPHISAYLKSSTDEYNIYDASIKYCDVDEYVEYKLGVYNDIDWLENTIDNYNIEENEVLMTDPIHISKFSDIKEVHYDINGYTKSLVETDLITIINEEDTVNNKKVTIKVSKEVPDDRLIFCINDYITGHYNDLIEELGKYNINLIEIDNNNIKYCQVATLLHRSIYFQLKYHIMNLSSKYFDGKEVYNTRDETAYPFCEFLYKGINDFFPNAKIEYKVFEIPRKDDLLYDSDDSEPYAGETNP